MRLYIFLFFLFLIPSTLQAQENSPKRKANQKGKFYAHWGWSREWFSKCDITFSGSDHDFVLTDVIAKDRQSPFSLDTYFNISKFTIPQYNFRIGYFLKDNWEISLGNDHMKYVVQTDQSVIIDGSISTSGSSYQGAYNQEMISIDKDFLRFEHTDGLNYINTELRHHNALFSRDKFAIGLVKGIGVGMMIPRTNTTLLGKQRYDEFHLSGFGLSAMTGIKFTFFQHFFIQPNFKVGYISMPNIRTTLDSSDLAQQNFYFAQYNVVFGGNFRL